MLQPHHFYMTIVLDDPREKTPGGLILPDNFSDAFRTGSIRAVGHGRWESGEFVRPPVQPGDKVLICQHVQTGPNGVRRLLPFPEFDDAGVKCVICDYNDIVGVIHESPSSHPIVHITAPKGQENENNGSEH